MELGDTPDVIHPARKQAVMQGTHSLGAHPALPLPQQHKLAASTYKRTMANVTRYLGYTPRNTRDLMRAAQEMFHTAADLQRREQAHRDELERLAVETVLKMPEFSSVREAIENGDLQIDARLEDADLSRVASETDAQEPDPEEYNIPEIKQQLDASVQKRRLLNAMIQGAAVSNNYAFSFYAQDELQAIDPTLAQDYGKLMSLTELGYWVQDDDMVRMAARIQDKQAGSVEIINEGGIPTIKARGISFPVLIQEITKGLMEYLSFEDEESEDTRKIVNKKTGFIEEETWSMLLGPALWRSFLDAIGGNEREIMPHLYDEIVRMPDSEFNALMRGIAEGSPQAKERLRQIGLRVKQQLGSDDQNESVARRIIGDES